MDQDSKKIANYYPLIALVVVAMCAALAITLGVDGDSLSWMHYFMGTLLCQFALLKLFDVSGFADGFQLYDLVAKDFRSYALVYPFIELTLGLAYLSFFAPAITYLVTIFIMVVGVVGVSKALQEGLKVNCSCMGTALNVPLSTVTLIEDVGMGAMALLMLLSRIF